MTVVLRTAKLGLASRDTEVWLRRFTWFSHHYPCDCTRIYHPSANNIVAEIRVGSSLRQQMFKNVNGDDLEKGCGEGEVFSTAD
jgi:hypothetical protein